ncbi:WD40-repeat-containing domain protein [Mycena sp. CBHHK59/15]|nr:WD40-repeat-containing domain protein [Mycena sp. CBHHK59/15]
MTDMFADDPWNVGMPKVTPEVGLPNEIAMLNNSGLLNDIIMHEGGTNNVIEPQLNVWASHREGQSDRSYPAKRMAITNPGRAEIDDAREVADIAKERAKAAIREKRELEAMLAKARQEMQGLRDEQQRQHAEMLERDTQWRTHLENFKGQVHHDFEQQRVRNYEYVKGQMQADLNAREAEYQKNLAEIEENNRRQEDIRRREQEREKADYETKLAAYHARFSSQRVGTRLAQDSGIDVPHFPDAPPEGRRLETIIRQGAGRFPIVSETAPTQPGPSTLLMDLNDPRVVQRLKGMVDELMTGKGGGVKKSSPRKKKIGTASALVKARKEEQEKLKPEDDRRWKKITIEHWRLKTGLNRAKDFYDYQGVTNETHEHCEDGETAPDANSNRCTLYFGFGWANTLWNQHIVDNLVKLVLRKRAEDPGRYDVPDVSDEYLKALFNNYLKEARAEWSRHQPRAGESLEDARERAEAYYLVKNTALSIMNIKHPGSVLTLAVTEDGTTLASGGSQGTRLWNVADMSALQCPSPAGIRGATLVVIWARQTDEAHDVLYASTQNGYFFCWRQQDGVFEETFVIQIPNPGEITAMAFDSTNNRLALCSRNDMVQSWAISKDPLTGKWLPTNVFSKRFLRLAPQAITFAAFDNRQDRDIIVLGYHNSGPIYTLRGNSGEIASEWSVGAKIGDAAFNWRDGVFCLDDPASGPALFRFNDQIKAKTYEIDRTRANTCPRKVRFGEHGSTVICGSDHGRVYVFDTRSGERLATLSVRSSEWVQNVATTEIDGVSVIFAAQTRALDFSEQIFVWK